MLAKRVNEFVEDQDPYVGLGVGMKAKVKKKLVDVFNSSQYAERIYNYEILDIDNIVISYSEKFKALNYGDDDYKKILKYVEVPKFCVRLIKREKLMGFKKVWCIFERFDNSNSMIIDPESEGWLLKEKYETYVEENPKLEVDAICNALNKLYGTVEGLILKDYKDE